MWGVSVIDRENAHTKDLTQKQKDRGGLQNPVENFLIKGHHVIEKLLWLFYIISPINGLTVPQKWGLSHLKGL